MRLEQIELPVNNKLLVDYWSGNETLHSFFEYKLNDEAFQTRFHYLKSKHYYNKELAGIVRQYMDPLGISTNVEENLRALEKGAVAVVGGQQAGILTGPLYSVHKAISVILLAKEQSEKFGETVVPIFWIAGEDHDLDEINHTFTIADGVVRKKGYSERSKLKTMASETKISKEAAEQFIQSVFRDYGETVYTQDLYRQCIEQLEQSETFTDFFARLMNELFKNEGLLMIDAAFAPFRQLESGYFVRMIEQNEQIASTVVKQEHSLDEAGYGVPIDAQEDNANLFYVKDGERFLLTRKERNYQDANGFIALSEAELLEIAKYHPEQLSNNVVTRPLMQEMTIPVLAFVGGPGELAYWATLKDAFRVLDLQMPILVPRLNITLVERKIDQLLSDYRLTVPEVMEGRALTLKEKYIESVQDEQAKQSIAELKQLISERYEQLGQHLKTHNLELHSILDKNLEYHERQLDYLTQKIEQQVLLKHDKTIRQFDAMQCELYPNENYQERIFNPYQYLNSYGPKLIEDLCALPLALKNAHYVIRL